VPRETVYTLVAVGMSIGMLWGFLSLQLWAADPTIWPALIAPLWIAALVGPLVAVDPLLLGAVVSAACGLVLTGLLFLLARARGA
jgi:hypothetical protein